MLKIPLDKLTIFHTVNGVVKTFRIDLLKIDIEDKNGQFRKLKAEFRSLKRSEDNLKEAQLVISELINVYYKNNNYPIPGNSITMQSLFCYAVMLYSAGFKNGKDNEQKLDRFLFELEPTQRELHKDIQDMRDKAYAHFDRNHEVKNYHLYLEVTRNKEKLVPLKINSSTDFVSAFHRANLEDWLKIIERILDLINAEIEVKFNKFKDLLGEIEVI